MTLRVETVVCPLTVVDDAPAGGAAGEAAAPPGAWHLAPPPAGAIEGWCTEINLLDGKIRDTLTQQFATGAYVALADFHKSQVTQAKDIVHGNIAALIALAKAIKDFV